MIRTFQISVARALEIAQGLTNQLQHVAPPGKTHVSDLEFGILLTYCMVAQGVREYPEATRLARAVQVCVQSSKAICDAIEAIGKQSDEEFTVTTTAPANKIPA